MKKQQIIHIGGGEAFNSRKQYLNYLKTTQLYHLKETPYNPWYKNITEKLDLQKNTYLKIPMPCDDNAIYEDWCLWFERHFEYFSDNLILIGHSLGGIFLAKYLSQNNIKYKISQLHLIAAPYDIENDVEQLNNFKITEFPNKLIEKNISDIHIYHSKDDDIVPFEESEKYHVQIPGSQLHVFEDRGHFLGEEFPELFKNIIK